ncbi:MAG: hypothetical protein WKG00_03310 [Polyangiaceae bacterium]
MSDLARRFPRLAFDGIEFPYAEITVRGSLRHHVHEFLHAPGGEIEGLKRRLYEINVSSDFSDEYRNYPRAWPERLGKIRTLCEKGESRLLRIPQIGEIWAMAIEWEQSLAAKMLSGERCKFKFLEDNRAENIATVPVVESVAALKPLAAQLQKDMEESNLGDFFDSIGDAIGAVNAVVDQVELAGNVLDSKIQTVTDACNRLDRSVNALKQPQNHAVVNSLHELAAAAAKLHKDVLSKATPVVLFRVPTPMTISQVSAAIYGSTAKAVELLKMNDIGDALAIPAGTIMRHYAKAA